MSCEHDRIVTCEVRDLVVRTYPILAQDKKLMGLMELLLFGDFPSANSPTSLVVPRSDLAIAAGHDPQKLPNSRTFKSGDYLLDFRNQVLPGLEFSEYDSRVKKAREITLNGLHPRFRSELKRALAVTPTMSTGLVHFVSGRPVSSKAARISLLKLHEQLAKRHTPKSRAAARLAKHLNEVSERQFRQLLQSNLPSAINVASGLREPASQRELAKLTAIGLQPKPFCGASERERTVRIFPHHVSICSLKNEVKVSPPVKLDPTSTGITGDRSPPEIGRLQLI